MEKLNTDVSNIRQEFWGILEMALTHEPQESVRGCKSRVKAPTDNNVQILCV